MMAHIILLAASLGGLMVYTKNDTLKAIGAVTTTPLTPYNPQKCGGCLQPSKCIWESDGRGGSHV